MVGMAELKKRIKIEGEIERINGKEVSYNEFVEKYLSQNKPVVVTGLMDSWRACKDWVDEYGVPNLSFFSAHFGNSKVQVSDCGSREFTDQRAEEMSVSDFVEYWEALNELDREQHKVSQNDDSQTKPLLYLKDWHFVKEYPEYVAYETPLFFTDDWLNLYLDQYQMHNTNDVTCSDYRFVYMGPKGTWTPLHADVFRSYSWSANVCGKKLWLFLPPDQRHLVFDRYMKNSVYNIFEDVNETKFPEFKKAVWLECTQLRNEIIFVPSGWYHQVHNLEDTISINHNWFNAYNLDWVWNLLVADYNEAKELIEDIRDISDDFEGLCQRNLAANTGMNFFDFFSFILRMSFANLVQFIDLPGQDSFCLPSPCSLAQHVILNLTLIRKIVLKMKSTCVAEDGDISLSIQKCLADPSFCGLYKSLGQTYKMIHEQSNNTCTDEIALQNDINVRDFTCMVVSNSGSLNGLINHVLEN